MISIIICSVNQLLLAQLKLNIAEKIGLPFEIIAIDNSTTKQSIAAVYNKGAALANFDCLCFLHEDVIIHTKDWGSILIELLSDQKIGLVGISGAVYKSKFPGTWASCDKSFYRTNSIQQSKNIVEPVITCINPGDALYTEVAVIDGVFMATRKDVWKKVQFDEKRFKGFHAYDLDYSLQVRSLFKVVVTFQVLLEHFSSGHLNKQWLDSSILLHKKWKHLLPVEIGKLNKQLAASSDCLACSQVLMVATKYKGYKRLVMHNYIKLLTSYFHFNRLKHTKTVIQYLSSFSSNEREN